MRVIHLTIEGRCPNLVFNVQLKRNGLLSDLVRVWSELSHLQELPIKCTTFFEFGIKAGSSYVVFERHMITKSTNKFYGMIFVEWCVGVESPSFVEIFTTIAIRHLFNQNRCKSLKGCYFYIAYNKASSRCSFYLGHFSLSACFARLVANKPIVCSLKLLIMVVCGLGLVVFKICSFSRLKLLYVSTAVYIDCSLIQKLFNCKLCFCSNKKQNHAQCCPWTIPWRQE